VKPRVIRNRCRWLRVTIDDINNFGLDKSIITFADPDGDELGVRINERRRVLTYERRKIRRALHEENRIFIPVCIGKDAPIGSWTVTIETDLTENDPPFIEIITGEFEIK
jgi:hypothetical protein